MKKLAALLCAVVLACGLTGTARGSSVYLAGVTASSGWSDVEQGTTNYCWLASASNMLAYAGWDGGASLTTAGDIFSYATGHWQNLNGNPYYAVEWWFDGNNSHPAIGTWPSVTGGGDFYPTAYDWTITRPIGFASNNNGLLQADIDSYLQYDVSNERVFTMLLGNTSGGIHFLTGWGYETSGAGGTGDITGVYFTDSFDGGAPALMFSPLNCGSGDCYLNVYTPYYLISMESLAFNSSNILPTNVPSGTVPDSASTLLLLGMGLTGLVAVRRRWRR